MPGPNTTGTPNILDLMLGRGEVFVADLKTDGTPKGFRHVGNVPSISVGTSIETKEHFSSMSGLKAQDLQVVLSDSRSITLQLEELNHQNLAIAFSGETATETNSGYAGFSEHLMVDDGELLAGHWYEIKNAAGLRAVDVDGTKLTVKTNEGPPNTLVEGVDYDLDAKFGKIFMRADSTDVTDAVALEVGLLVTLTADSSAVQTSNLVKGLTSVPVAKAVKIIIENAASGEKTEVQFHKVRLKANGDMSLISDEWQVLPLEGAIEENTGADANSPYFTVRSLGEPLPQIIGAFFRYDEIAVESGELVVYFDKAIQVDRSKINALGDIRFRTADTLTGDWVGSESEYRMNEDVVEDLIIGPRAGHPGQYQIILNVGLCAASADSLASENTATINFAAVGITAGTGHAMPTATAFAIVSEPL
jgi:hypothetical protein